MKSNIAMSLLGALGMERLFQNAVPTPVGLNRSRPGRYGRAVNNHRERKSDFAKTCARTAKHIGVARKVALGTLTMPGGRRGMQARRVSGKGRNSVYLITA